MIPLQYTLPAFLKSTLFNASCLCLCFIFCTVNVQAREVIQSYDSIVSIASDSSLTVTEIITVNAEGNEIKRGIFRDFPTKYKDPYGHNYQVDFNLLNVLRDGKPEDYHVESISNGVRIYIGHKDRYLGHGSHTYELQYYTNRQLGFFDEYDELYWNVTGNDWAFPILQASAKILLPPAVTINQIETDGYTGAMGEQGKNFISSNPDDNTVLFESTEQMPVNHGLSIVVNWPKGYVTEPSKEQKLTWFIQDNRATLVGFSGLSILFVYLLLAWLKVGKDPEKGIIYPIYSPDKDHSPASMRFVTRMSYDKKSFAAALVNMAVKGYLTISETTSDFVIKKTGHSVQLSAGEAVIANKLFNHRNQITLEQSEHRIIGKALKAHQKVLERDYEKIFFNTNKMTLLPAWLLSIIVLVMTVLSIKSSEARAVVGFFTLWLSFWSIGVAFLLISAFRAWKNVRGFLSLLPALFSTAFALPFLFGEGFGLYMMWENAGSGVLLIFILVIVTNILFYEWMKAPTLKGRALLDRIDGFKLYLTVAEAEEMNARHGTDAKQKSGQKPSAELTPELFEKYLPYAMALDVEKPWSQRFTSVFSQLGNQTHHAPIWYHGNHWNPAKLSNFSSTLSGGLSSSVAASSTAPGSSSGSSGGGSSGGGGGGGGGGGW